jgi:adenylate kinase
MKNIILIGLPGSGKNTQAKKLSSELGYQYISTTDLIKEEQEKGSTIGDLATKLDNYGSILPDDILTTLVKQKIIDSDNKVGFVFEEYPKTVDQAKMLDEFLYNRKTPITYLINLVVSDEVIKNTILSEGVVDEVHAVSIKINDYKNKISPMVNYFRNRKSIFEINGEKSEKEVFIDIQKVIN